MHHSSFGSAASFLRWFGEQPVRTGDRLIVGYDLRTWRLLAALVEHNAECPAWGQREIPLPVQKNALQALWREFNEANLILFFLCEGTIETILVAVRHGLWKSLDERYMPSPKNKFREITFEEAESICGGRRISALSTAAGTFGIGSLIFLCGETTKWAS